LAPLSLTIGGVEVAEGLPLVQRLEKGPGAAPRIDVVFTDRWGRELRLTHPFVGDGDPVMVHAALAAFAAGATEIKWRDHGGILVLVVETETQPAE